jgi:hypothetical protein
MLNIYVISDIILYGVYIYIYIYIYIYNLCYTLLVICWYIRFVNSM